MKNLVFVCSAALTMFSATAFAQDIIVDDFSTYADTAAARAVYKSKAGNGSETVTLFDTGGANGTDKWLRLDDNGWTAGIGADNLMTPPAGTYRLNFYYKNGVDGGKRWRGLKVTLLQANSTKQVIIVNEGTSAPDVTEWTFAETEAFSLTNAPISIRFDSAESNGGDPLWYAAVDEIKLTPLDGPALTVFPDSRVYLSGTEKLVASPEGGSGTYTKVEFDVGNNGTVDHTATTAPYEFTWNTLSDVAAGTSRTQSTTPPNTALPVKITVTDSNNDTKTIIENYTIDNMYAGRQSMITNGDFSQWTDGDNFGSNLPVGWVEHNAPADKAQYGPGESYSPEAGKALKIIFTGGNDGDNLDRYTLRSEGKTGRYRDMQATWWGKGPMARFYYFTSSDGGATFVNTFQTAGEAGSDTWVFVVESPVQNNIGLNDTTQVALATHIVGSNVNPVEQSWDDLTWEGMLIPNESDVSDWNLY